MNIKLIVLLLSILGLFSQEVNAFTDPTRPPASIQNKLIGSPAMLVLNAILARQGRKIAVINGFYKKVGDEILGQYITAIGKTSVQLQGPNGKLVLFLFGRPIKSSGWLQCKRNLDLC